MFVVGIIIALWRYFGDACCHQQRTYNGKSLMICMKLVKLNFYFLICFTCYNVKNYTFGSTFHKNYDQLKKKAILRTTISLNTKWSEQSHCLPKT